MLNHDNLFYTQRKEWTWDESKMLIMHDPIYRLVTPKICSKFLYVKQI